MHNWPLQLRLFRKPRFIPLRYRVVLASAGMLILLLGVLLLTLVWFQNRNIRHQLEQRGKAIAQSLVATSTKALLNYDYITLEQFANRAAQDPNILYVVVHDKEHRVAGFSNRPELQGQKLTDAISLDAVATTFPLVQRFEEGFGSQPGLDVALPVFLPDSTNRWGTIRVGLSLTSMYRQIRQTIWIIAGIGMVALFTGTIISVLGAQRVTRSLGELVWATKDVAEGNFTYKVGVKTGDEVEVLAANFAVMTREILEHQERQGEQLKEIQRLQDYTEKLMITMADGLLSVDMKGTVVTINPAARTLLGLSSINGVEGKNIAAILGESCRLVSLVQKIIHQSAAVAHREIEITKEPESQTILVGSSILHGDQGQPLEIILNLHDITELKKLEARIRQSERLAGLGTLAAGMAHEIRNPLSAIKTFVQLLPRKVDKPGFLEKFNRTVPRETERINFLVDELLELSRLPRYEFAATNINGLLRQAIDTTEEELQRCNIEYQQDLQDNLPPVQADSNQLIKAFNNLIRNAIQAMPTGGQLTVRTFIAESTDSGKGASGNTDSKVVIIFQDTGQGIASKELKQIFNPFFTTKDAGTGLGLAITHKVVTEHGGLIEAESKKEQGTMFTIQLPLDDTISVQAVSSLELI
ncbi:ATP-binding protein [Desulfosediminicola ganghwensis]|uniref:ATP-binding protein n=1 Tax=Desulfosediminicola ganghwensis TaxID=2569540 RepID=UPI001E2C2869|nr:ATP-binding protein [Desulfosediminicola ganghwensis]